MARGEIWEIDLAGRVPTVAAGPAHRRQYRQAAEPAAAGGRLKPAQLGPQRPVQPIDHGLRE